MSGGTALMLVHKFWEELRGLQNFICRIFICQHYFIINEEFCRCQLWSLETDVSKADEQLQEEGT